jgi:hypothetical protein
MRNPGSEEEEWTDRDHYPSRMRSTAKNALAESRLPSPILKMYPSEKTVANVVILRHGHSVASVRCVRLNRDHIMPRPFRDLVRIGIFLLLILHIAAPLIHSAPAVADEPNPIGYTYGMAENDTVAIFSRFYGGSATEFTVPGFVEAYPHPVMVGGIDPYAFEGNDRLESVSIPCSIAFIGVGAFANCTSLQNVTFFGGSDCDIGEGAFANCTSLRSIVLPEHFRLGNGTFDGCTSLTNLRIGSAFECDDSWSVSNGSPDLTIFYFEVGGHFLTTPTWHGIRTVPMTVPLDVSARFVNGTTLLTWSRPNDPAGSIIAYNIYASEWESGGFFDPFTLMSEQAGSEPATNITLFQDHMRYYKVSAVYIGGEGPISETVAPPAQSNSGQTLMICAIASIALAIVTLLFIRSRKKRSS